MLIRNIVTVSVAIRTAILISVKNSFQLTYILRVS